MTFPLVPFLVAAIGLVLYLALDGKASEVGKWGFIVGLFFLVAFFAPGGSVVLR